MVPRRGIAAGSNFAIFELAALLGRPLEQITRQVPQAMVSLHVYDLNCTATGRCEEEVSEEAGRLAAVNHQEFEVERGLPLDRSKAYLVASEQGLA